MFVATKLLSRQTYFCLEKKRVLCHDKHVFVVFVVTKPLLQLLSGKTFVVTKRMLMAARANDSFLYFLFSPLISVVVITFNLVISVTVRVG